MVVIDNLRHKYILGQVLHWSYQFSTGYLTTGKHFITINGQVISQLISQPLDYPIVNKCRITLPPVSVSILEVKTPKLKNTTNLYKMNAVTAQFPEGMILLDVLVLNVNNVPCSISKNMPIASMHTVGTCEEVQEVSWNSLQCDTPKHLPQILQNTRLQLKLDSKVYLGLFQIQRFLKSPEQNSGTCWRENTLT